MKKLSIVLLAFLSLVAVGTASAHKSKVTLCHKGHTLSVDSHAVKAHLGHGDTLGACKPTTPPNDPPVVTPGGDIPVTVATFSRASRILACADRPVLRVADKTMGIAVDLTVEVFKSGVYGDAKFTIARYYAGVGATCDNLGGTRSGTAFVNDYPVWVR